MCHHLATYSVGGEGITRSMSMTAQRQEDGLGKETIAIVEAPGEDMAQHTTREPSLSTP